MEIALYILGMIGILAVIWLIINVVRTLRTTDQFIEKAEGLLGDIRKDINQMTSEVTVIRIHTVPVLDNIASISEKVSGITEGLAPRV